MQRLKRQRKAKRWGRFGQRSHAGGPPVLTEGAVKPLDDWSEFDSMWSGENIEENLLAQVLEDRRIRRAALNPPPPQ